MGIELRAQRGQIGATFLGRELGRRLEALFGSRSRATGKRAARAGAVAWIDVRPAVVSASVDDQHAAAVTAEIAFRAFRDDERAAFQARCAQDPALLLSILDGSFTADQESALLADELSLLPGSLEDVFFDCTCGSGMSVCPHVYALVYVLVEQVDAEPADLLVLRGMSVEELHAAPAPPDADEADSDTADADVAGPRDAEGTADADAESEASRGQISSGISGGAFIPAQLDLDILLELVSDQTRDLFADFYRAGGSITGSE